jgi:hypothetical protein
MVGIFKFRNGMTVKELKEIIADWPEEYDNGEPCEVWVGDRGLTNQVVELWPLNKQGDIASVVFLTTLYDD